MEPFKVSFRALSAVRYNSSKAGPLKPSDASHWPSPAESQRQESAADASHPALPAGERAGRRSGFAATRGR